jgi:hypothetical protein
VRAELLQVALAGEAEHAVLQHEDADVAVAAGGARADRSDDEVGVEAVGH